jgi:hypothetical protein
VLASAISVCKGPVTATAIPDTQRGGDEYCDYE